MKQLQPEKILAWAKVGGIVAGVYIGYKVLQGVKGAGAQAEKFVTETINPASPGNFVYSATGGNDNYEVIEENDKFFAYGTLLNPFASAESKNRARALLNTFYGE